jgi:hypothetical protein
MENLLLFDLFALLFNCSLTTYRALSFFRRRKELLRFPACLRSTKRQHVTRLALERFTNPFEGVECNSLGLILLQPPERRMTYAGFFSQPIEGPLMLFQQLINSYSDHGNAQASRSLRAIYHSC